MAEKNTTSTESDVAVEETDTDTTLDTSQDTYGIEALDGDDDDFVSITALLGVEALGLDGSDTEDSPSEIEDDDSADETDTDPDTESGDATDVEEESANEVAGEDPAAEANATKSSREPKDMKVLRQAKAFRNEIEPLIKGVRKELPEVVGIATALKSGGPDALGAIRNYSESAAASLEAAILEQRAGEYIAAKHGIDAAALETVLKGGEAIVPSKGLAEEIALLTEEGQEELAKLLKKSPVEGEQVKRLQGQVQQVTEVLQKERVGAMQEKIDDKFAVFVKALKIEGDLEDLQEKMVVKLSKDPKAMDAYNSAAKAAAEGRKADGKRLLEEFYVHLADKTKKLRPAGATVTAPAAKTTTAKAPAVPKPANTKAKAATATETTASKTPSMTAAERSAKLLSFTKTRAKEYGIAFRG